MANATASRMEVGQFREFAGTVVRCLPDDLESSTVQDWIDNPEAVRKALREIFMPSGEQAENGAYIIDLDANPFVPNGWKIEEHIKGGQFKWDLAKVALHLSEDQQNGNVIQGNQLRGELKGKPVYNANLLDFLLAHPNLIPESWKDQGVFFWGTIYRDRDGDLGVRYLCWRTGGWRWDFFWLGRGFHGGHPAAVPASS